MFLNKMCLSIKLLIYGQGGLKNTVMGSHDFDLVVSGIQQHFTTYVSKVDCSCLTSYQNLKESDEL